jgi:hypothetical protein
MNKKRNKTILILALVSIVLCTCPGCALMVSGLGFYLDAVGEINNFGDYFAHLGYGIRQGGWLILPGFFFVMIPFILGIVALLKNPKEDHKEPQELTGDTRENRISPTG